MPQHFDATTKFLVELNPTDWLHLLGLPLGPTRIAEAELSTVLTEVNRLLEYVVLSRRRLQVPVVPVAVLLRSFAGHATLRGRHLVLDPESQLTIDFRYRVLRVWQMPPEVFLAGGLAVLPLATIAKVRRSDMSRLLERIKERLEREADKEQADRLRTATFLLMGMKFEKAFVDTLMNRNVLELSSTYRALHDEAKAEGRNEGLAEGRTEATRKLILSLGERRFGVPSPQTKATLEALTDADKLALIAERLLSVESWSELLA
jgi:predicted transposase YdaD